MSLARILHVLFFLFLLLLFVSGFYPNLSPVLLLSAQSSSPSTASTTLTEGMAADQLLTFADQLLREGEYFRAITEYQRFLFHYSHDQRRAMAHFRIGLALYRGQDYLAALEAFRQVAAQYPATPYGQQAWLWQGESLLQRADYSTAERLYNNIIVRKTDEPIVQFAHYQRGWSLLYQRQWQEASAAFQHVSPESPLYSTAQRLANEALAGKTLPRKSPALAGILSAILPGSGQLYNRRPGDALLSFVLNGVFIVGTLQALEHRQLAIAGILSFFEAGWYTGNVYSAVNGAHKYNRHTTATFLGQLEHRFRLQPPEAQQVPALGLHLGFRF